MAPTADNKPGYVEDENFVPSPTDMTGYFQTTRTGVPNNHDVSSPVFAQDRRAVAQAISDGTTEVLYTEQDTSAEAEQERLEKRAASELEKAPLQAGAPTEAEQEAAKEGDEKTASGTDTGREQPDTSDVLTSRTNAQDVADASLPQEDKKASTTRKSTRSSS